MRLTLSSTVIPQLVNSDQFMLTFRTQTPSTRVWLLSMSGNNWPKGITLDLATRTLKFNRVVLNPSLTFLTGDSSTIELSGTFTF